MENNVLLIISGGIAAYKALDLVRSLHKQGTLVQIILTEAGAKFVTPLSLATLSSNTVHQDLFSLTEDNEMGHIDLSRSADLILVSPASANIMAKMASGLADDLATNVLLATDKPVMIAPAMNVHMWEHPATQENLKSLMSRGVKIIQPEEGEMACGEYGIGRLAETEHILETIDQFFNSKRRLCGYHALVTSGPTHEAIDPIRYITNRSSGKQGHAIASSLAALGANTTLVSGPTGLPDPNGVSVVHVESACDMLDACKASLPADIAVCAAAVSDWRPVVEAPSKLKKATGVSPKPMDLVENPDILCALTSAGHLRPGLLIGFAAETEDILENAAKKRESKNCDWILANDVSRQIGTFGSNENTVYLVDDNGVENWPTLSKTALASRLANRIADKLEAIE